MLSNIKGKSRLSHGGASGKNIETARLKSPRDSVKILVAGGDTGYPGSLHQTFLDLLKGGGDHIQCRAQAILSAGTCDFIHFLFRILQGFVKGDILGIAHPNNLTPHSNQPSVD